MKQSPSYSIKLVGVHPEVTSPPLAGNTTELKILPFSREVLRIDMDRLDKDILNRIQSQFPITSRPFKVLGEEFKVSEAEVIQRVKRLTHNSYIRRLGASFDSKKLGFTSTLCAARVPPEKVEDFVKVLHLYPGITHNYRRIHEYNIWFTFIGGSKEEVLSNLADISKKTGVKEILNLPARKSFKINVEFET